MLYFAVPTVALLVVLGLAASASLLAALLHFTSRGRERAVRKVLLVALAVWALGLAVAVLPAAPQPDPSIPTGTFNWIPFLAHQERDLGVEMVANLGLFAPLGLVLAFYWRRFAVLKTTVLVLGLSVCVETTQLLLRNNRASDITDVITNTAGGFAAAFIGWALVTAARRRLTVSDPAAPESLHQR
ncbi:VanZ family protein [Paeniglutamicibacter psychrophenolicus]|uniref:VanZ family protein n=1 Tax=Paeniglutamicibacter psychrophenolicus TaxID=257454 RepID=UPI00277E91A0|nr:VanZ family protein [Paeniglutamicibacter psychrophenolicus]MDQ0092340.1 glycopeptide antibiotics resistance protein [Paeniglutamicibacter psychrophenolicus]